MNYYNEFDPYAAQWLQNLVDAGLIPRGDIDARSILDVRPSDLAGYTQCHFFAGIAGWPLALTLAGWPEDRPVWTGSCPCQPLSSAGKQKGHADERHIWPAFYELISECGPATVFGEQVASRDGREWFCGVRADLEAVGYAVGGADLCAAGVCAPHIRQRLFWVADANSPRRQLLAAGPKQKDGATWGQRRWGYNEPNRIGKITGLWADATSIRCTDGKTRRIEPGVSPLAHGVPARVGKLRAYGNAIVAPLAAEFIKAFMQ